MTTTHKRLNIAALDRVYLPVRDAKLASAWFKRHFGMTESAEGPRPSVRLPGGAALTLVESEKLNAYESSPFHFKCNDARSGYAELVRNGVQASEPVNWSHYVDFRFRDPDGNPIGVISDPSWTRHPNNYFRLDGIFLGCAGFETTLAWYLDVLGVGIAYDFTVETPTTPNARMCSLHGVPITLFHSPPSVIAHRVCDYVTEDAAADHRYLQALNVEVSPLVQDGAARRFSFLDPEGREFGMMEYVSQ